MRETIVIPYLLSITPLGSFRKTPDVDFMKFDDIIDKIDAIEYVVHEKGAKSPQIKGDKTHYWYMHTHQKDNLIVHSGYRVINLFSKRHGRVETIEASAKYIKLNGKIIHVGPAMMSWPPYVFHRISSPQGSISTNYAYHHSNMSDNTNFSIYDLNEKTGEYRVVREGSLDEKVFSKKV